MIVHVKNKDYIPYETKMCYFNDVSPLIEFKVMHLEEHHECHYDIGGMTPLSSYLESHEGVSTDFFVDFLSSLEEGLKVCEKYLLDTSHLKLSMDNIYYDGHKFGMILVPKANDSNIRNMVRELFLELSQSPLTRYDDVYEKLHQIRLALDEEPFVFNQFVNCVLTNKVKIYD